MHRNHWATSAFNLTKYTYGNNEKVEGECTLRALDFVYKLQNEEFASSKTEGGFRPLVSLDRLIIKRQFLVKKDFPLCTQYLQPKSESRKLSALKFKEFRDTRYGADAASKQT